MLVQKQLKALSIPAEDIDFSQPKHVFEVDPNFPNSVAKQFEFVLIWVLGEPIERTCDSMVNHLTLNSMLGCRYVLLSAKRSEILPIAWPCAGDGSFRFLPYQLSMLG